jgi:hypothetical protein
MAAWRVVATEGSRGHSQLRHQVCLHPGERQAVGQAVGWPECHAAGGWWMACVQRWEMTSTQLS